MSTNAPLHEIEPDVCLPNPCQHGICQRNNSEFSCLCDAGWTGTRCNTGKF